jgi:formylglycine-generating enzyme required for sulfatase activity
MQRPVLYLALSLSLSPCLVAFSQEFAVNPQGEQILGPQCQAIPEWFAGKARVCQPDEYTSWLKDVQHWRDEFRIRIGFDPSEYDRSELKWTQSSFIQPQMMVHDRFFYDPALHSYTVDKYLDDLKARYGGIDSVLIFHYYPNIGIDDRNAFDMFNDLPGGTEGVRRMVDDFHRNGVKVLFALWVGDLGTRQEEKPLWEALAKELAAVGADGVNGDTLRGIPRTFRTASDALHHPLALEPEVGLSSDEMVNYNNMTWGYWNYSFIPTISRYKWLETRHMVNICNRWAHNHLDDLQFAFFNGIGFVSWENIWGIWNQLTPRDAEALRRIATIERAYSDLLVSPAWEPHVQTVNFGIFASKWPGDAQTLWTIVNRNSYAVSGDQLRVPVEKGARYFDVWHGTEIIPHVEGNEIALSFEIEANGYGAILKTASLDARDGKLMATMKALAAKPLNSFSPEWKTLPQSVVEIAATAPASAAPTGMIRIPEGDFNFRVHGIEIEGMNDEGVDVQYPGEPSPRRYHDMTLHMKAFWIDRYNVTNEDFKKFLDATHYQPEDAHNFLRDWKDGNYPDGWAKKPVTWVSLEDARAYAAWAGKRLPHEWEWQYAAQGTDGRKYPWGNCDWLASAAVSGGPTCPWGSDPKSAPAPIPDKGRQMLAASDVDQHPNGASPFGVMDMVGNVWQWTDEYVDSHTRAAILRGGSHYQPQGAIWYFPQAYMLSEHGKYLLMAPSLDRSGALGFRCAKDAE